MSPGPFVDALIEHLVGDLSSYALDNSFPVVVEGAVLARADPRARGGLQLGDRRGGWAGHQERGVPLSRWSSISLVKRFGAVSQSVGAGSMPTCE